jgi:hypothetical protein
MGAGILPIAFYKGHIYFLFGREYINSVENGKKWEGAGLWSDFGGSKEKNENYKTTAIREGIEETGGILGTKTDIKRLVENSICEITKNGYRTFIVIIDYDKSLPKRFRNKFMSIKNNKPHLIQKNGLYEKDMVKWFSYDSIKRKSNTFRPWYYNEILKELLTLF